MPSTETFTAHSFGPTSLSNTCLTLQNNDEYNVQGKINTHFFWDTGS